MKLLRKIKQLFCHHTWGEYVKRAGPGGFVSISGEQIYIACSKCHKIQTSYYREYEGRGYK